ncbi:hypothetical protein EYZ11_009488 [Aspergillus tanneri]|uniref:Uncharacterized protein n=1 Tax=Aspergillus tanneri TaxID=1220188 RepID=A0A4S3J9V7_9EURO|nr:uncharacterized protein ATNIH1004_010351 [Aspergillus tanneri]KAA8643582.1 hypothetical protein ATNIH1004_010351 [Aspergillus tanneri]THC91048.1 hypothetical protein EYZ11_009488 [Aspergillus tanneri]
MADGKAEVTEIGAVDVSPVTKPSFKSRVAAHFKRFWWVHVIVLIVVVLVVTLPVVYVGYPNIAQHDINDSSLEVTELVISDPTPESFHFKQTQVIHSDSIFHPKIYAFDADVSLAGEKPFARAHIPEVKANDGTVVHVEQNLDLSDVDAFGGFAKAVMLNKEIQMNVYGRPNLKQGGLPKITITYNKTVTMNGLNKLEGFKMLEMRMGKKDSDGNNGQGKVSIPNPSVMSITMGNVTLNLSVEGTHIGESFLNDLVLRPGNNTVDMKAKINTESMIPFLSKFKDNVVPVDITGNSSVYNGKELPYFASALAANKLTVDMDILSALA